MPYLDALLRPADPDDAMAVAHVHVRSWQAAYKTLLPDDYLSQLRPEDRAQKYDFTNIDPLNPRTIVADEDGSIHRFMGLLPRRHLAMRICRSMESFAHSMWIRKSEAGVLALPLSQQLAPSLPDLDFKTRFFGC
jgi:hypothetical protein